ncbi:MAG: head GIN domain-containing protein [Bacteroidota bacterium]
MNQLKWISSLLVVCTLLFSACNLDLDDDDDGLFDCESGKGEVVTDEISIGDFTGIKLRIGADVYIRQGSPQKVEIEAQQNIINQLDRDIDNDNWEIEFDGCVKNHRDIRVFVTLPEIKNISIEGSGSVFSENTLDADQLVLRISGSGDMDLAVDADELDTKISGSGDIKIEGKSNEFDLRINGSGDFRAFNMDAERGDIRITGSGNAEVTVENVLDVNITGSGDVRYRGNPTINEKITGSGDLIDAN